MRSIRQPLLRIINVIAIPSSCHSTYVHRRRDALVPEHLFRGDRTGAGGAVTPMPVRGRVRGVMMGRAGRPLDDGIAGAGWAVVTTVLAAMVPARRLEVLGLVAAAGAAPQEVRTAAAAQEVRAGAGAPLQLLQLGPVVFRAAGHASGGISSVTPAGQASTRASQSVKLIARGVENMRTTLSFFLSLAASRSLARKRAGSQRTTRVVNSGDFWEF